MHVNLSLSLFFSLRRFDSGFGGWSCDDFARGVRVISFSQHQEDDELVGETYIRLEDGSVIDRIQLGVPIADATNDRLSAASSFATVGASLWLFIFFMAAATAIGLGWIYMRPRHPGLRRRKGSASASSRGWRALPLRRTGRTPSISSLHSGNDDDENQLLDVQMSIVY